MADANMRRSANVTLDGNGYGAIRIAPSAKTWHIRYITVGCSSNSSEAIARVYQNHIGPAYLLDQTLAGSTGDTSDTQIDVYDGYCLWIEWTGGTAGATATVTYSGEEY